MLRSVRHLVSAALSSALLVSAVALGSTPAQAQGQAGTAAPGTWQTSINIQNQAESPASVQVDFYDANGAVIKTYTPSEPIKARGSLSVFVPNEVASLPAGQFSAVVNSDQPVRATINTSSTNSNTGPWTAFGYEGIGAAETGTNLHFPGLYKGYYNFSSELVIQNADTAPATLTAKFYNRSGTEVASVPMGTVAANASKTFPTASLAALPSGNSAGLFSAVVTSTEGRKLAGIANIWRSSPTNGTASYNASISGSSALYAPALYKNYYGFGSALTLQSVGGAAAGTITYSNGTTEPFTLTANASREFYQPGNAALPTGNQAGVFSARVTTTSGRVAGIVSTSIANGTRGDFASYNLPGAAAAQVSVPHVLSDYYGYFSAVTVQNVGSQTTNITITYANGQTRTFNGVAANGTVNITHLNKAGDVLPDRTSTAATVSSSNSQSLVAVLQHNTEPNVNGYDARKAPSDFLMALTGAPR